MSKISISCPSCAKRYGVPEEYAGKQFKCKDCGASIKIPGATASAPKEDAQAKKKKKPAARRTPARRRPAPARKRAGAASRDRDEEEAPSRGGARRAQAGARRAPGGAQRRRPSRSRRGGRGDRDEDYDDGGYGHGQDSSKALVYGSAIGVLVLTIAAVVYFGFFFEGNRDPRAKKKKKSRSSAAREESFSRPKIVHNPEDDASGFEDEEETQPEDNTEPKAEKPESEPEKKPEKEPAKAEPEKPKKAPLPPLPQAKPRKLEHLKSTPEDQRTEIDEAVAVVADPWSGAKGSRNKRALVKIGKSAVPALLSAMVDLDFTDGEQRKAMPMLTEALQEICKNPNSWICRVGMKETEEEEVYYCKYRRAQWFAWYDSSRGKRFMKEK